MLQSASRTVRVNRLVSLLVWANQIGTGGEQKRPLVFRRRRGWANTGSRSYELRGRAKHPAKTVISGFILALRSASEPGW